MHTAARPTPISRTRTAVRLVQIRKTYPDGTSTIEALRSVSLALAPGSITAIMGASGSGKSTLLHCAAGLEAPTSGHVLLGDVDLAGLSSNDRARLRRSRVGFVFQAYNLIDHLTVAENIALPLLLDGRAVEPEWQQWLLDALGIADLTHRTPRDLSGGQAQRVAIARALITHPTVVFADEPTAALDSHTGAHVLDALQHVTQQAGQTLVIVTHDAAVAAIAGDVLLLADGAVSGRMPGGTPDEIRAQSAATR